MEINNYCSKIYNLCLNYGKTSNLVDTNSLFEKNDLLFLRNTNSENILTEIIPNYKLADGFQLFFNYLSKLLNLNILYLVNYFFYSIIILTFGSLLYSIHKSNLNNKLILITTTTLFYLSNIYLYNYNAEYLIYSISSILPLIFLIQFYYNKKQINLIYLFSFSFLAIIIFGTMRYYSYLSFLLISLILVLTLKKSFFKKTFFIISIIILLLLKIFFFHNVEEIRKNNIKLANPNFNYEKSIPGNSFYTTFYPGLGFLSNNHVQNGFLDSSNYTKSLLPKDYDEKYGDYFITESHYKNIKKEIWNLIFNQPKFILKTIFAKIGILILYLLIICNFFLKNFFLNIKINKVIKYS